MADTDWCLVVTDIEMSFLDAFAKFTDYVIIWRFDADFLEANEYQHIHLVPWFPQDEFFLSK